MSANGIDGTARGLREVLILDLPDVRKRPDVEVDVVRYLHAADDAVRGVRAGEPLGTMLLRSTAARLPGGGPDPEGGEIPWRTTDRWFGVDGPASAYLLAVPPGAELRTGAEQWAAWVDSDPDLPLVTKLALGAYQLITLAPLDNSDRLAHLYIVLELIRAGALSDQILPASLWFDRRRDEYHARHRAVAVDHDLDGWIGFIAEGITQLCQNQLNIVKGIEKLRDEFLGRLGKRNDSLARAVNALLGTPVTNRALIAERSGVSHRHSHDLIKKLQNYGFIQEMGRRKQHKLHEVPEVVRLLSVFEGFPEDGDRVVFDPPD